MLKHSILFSVLVSLLTICYGQNGNVTINNMTLTRVINGFYDYIQTENIKGISAVATATLSNYSDSATYIEIELYPISSAYLRGDDSMFFGYIMKDSFYCFFIDNHKYLQRDTSVLNPDVIKQPGLKFVKTDPKQKNPRPNYHPYKWEIIFRGNTILEMSPKSTIEKYVSTL